jgi:hypothetical protein
VICELSRATSSRMQDNLALEGCSESVRLSLLLRFSEISFFCQRLRVDVFLGFLGHGVFFISEWERSSQLANCTDELCSLDLAIH